MWIYFGIALCVVGAASLAAATLSMRGVSSSGNFLMIVGLQMLVGSLTLWIPAMMLETPTIVRTNAFVYAFIYTTLVPGLLATLVWFILVDRIGAVRASTYHFLNPFFGVAIAAAILREGLSTLDILGVAIVAGGILAVQIAKRS